MRHIAQPLDSFGQVTPEPAPSRLLACADDLGETLRRAQALLDDQQEHLRARSEARLAGDAVRLLQSVELLRAKGWGTDGFYGLLIRP